MSESAAEMTCREFVELVTEYLEGALSEARRAELHAHMDECGGCTEYLRQIRLTVEALGELPLDNNLAGTREAAIEAFHRFHAEDGRAHG